MHARGPLARPDRARCAPPTARPARPPGRARPARARARASRRPARGGGTCARAGARRPTPPTTRRARARPARSPRTASGPGPKAPTQVQLLCIGMRGILAAPGLTDESICARGERSPCAPQPCSSALRQTATATSRRPTGSRARPPRGGAELVVLPEKWPVLGTPEQTAAGAEPLDGPALAWARATARELGIDLVAGSIAERVEGADRGANTSVHVGPDGEDRATYRKIHMFDVEVGGRTYRESEHEAPGDEPVTVGARRRHRAGPDHLLRPALPGAVPHPRGPRRQGDHRPGRVHRDDDARPLGGPAARAGDRGPVLRGRREPDRRVRAGPARRRALDDRRPVGPRARAGARRRDVRRRRPRPRPARGDPDASCRRSPTARPPPTAGPRRPAREGRRGRQAPADPRRGGARVRAPGLPHVSRLGHRRRGGRRLRARLPLLPVQGRGARHAVPRALGADARRDRRDRRAADRPAREALRDRVVHRRLLPPRPRADEGDHRRGHARGEHVRPDAPAGDPQGVRADRGHRRGRAGRPARSATRSARSSPRWRSTARSSRC